jgi:hypothetical protein
LSQLSQGVSGSEAEAATLKLLRQARARDPNALDWRLGDYAHPGNRARGSVEGDMPEFDLDADFSRYWDKPPPPPVMKPIKGPSGGWLPAAAYLDVRA